MKFRPKIRALLPIWARIFKCFAILLVMALVTDIIVSPWDPRVVAEKRTFKHLPNCLIIGARKCGTRALLEFLNLHPDIVVARQETHFFDKPHLYARGVSWYRSKMPSTYAKPAVVVEKTPAYFVDLAAVQRIFRYNASIKLILILRNPVTRLISDYTQVHYVKLSKRKRHPTLEEAIFGYRINTSSISYANTSYKPLKNSLYSMHIKKWLKFFKLNKNLHIVDGDMFIKNPMIELRKIERFLNVDQKISDQSIFFNSSKGFYCYRNPLEGDKCLGDSKGRKHLGVDRGTIEKLRKFFEPYNRKLFFMINRTFEWSLDHL